MPELTTSSKTIEDLLQLRLVVAYLGESKQFGWWDTCFLDATGLRFMESVFPRTALLAAMSSAVDGAAKVHDAAIGKVGFFHLFRLGADLENLITGRCPNRNPQLLIQSRETALAFLEAISDPKSKAAEGPLHVATTMTVLRNGTLSKLAAAYRHAFATGVKCYPYFLDA
jgi:hypothetical protein